MTMHEETPHIASPGTAAKSIKAEFLPQGGIVPVLSAITWIRGGWQLFKRSPGKLFAMLLFVIFVTIVLSRIPVFSLPKLVFPLFLGGIMAACNKLAEGKKIAFSELFTGFSVNPDQLFVLGLFYMLGGMCVDYLLTFVITDIVVSQTLPFGGKIHLKGIEFLLYLPVVMACFFAPALIVLNNVKAFKAIKTGFLALLRNFPAFLLYVLLLFILIAIALMPFASLTSMLISVETGKGSIMIVAALIFIVFPITLAVASLIFCSVFMAYRAMFYPS